MRPTSILLAAIIASATIALAVISPAVARGGGGQGSSPSTGQYSSYATPPGFIGDREGWDNGGTPPGWKRGKKAG